MATNNIISINGYRLQYQDGEPMIQDLELAQRLGYERPRAIRDLIKRLLREEKLNRNNIRRTVEQSQGEAGRPSEVFYLDEFAAIKVTTKSEAANADEITNEVIRVFIDAKRGKRPSSRAVDPVIAKARQASALMATYLSIGKMLGTDVPMARAIAVEKVREETGMNFLPLLSNNQVEAKPLTPTELGKELGMDAKKTNALLARAGLQHKDEHGNWQPTEVGKPFCTVNPYKSQHSDHTGYRVLWYQRVIDALPKTDVPATGTEKR